MEVLVQSPPSNHLELCTGGRQQSGMKQKLLSPAFIPQVSTGVCVSPINQEMSRHDVIAITTIAAFLGGIRACLCPYMVGWISYLGGQAQCKNFECYHVSVIIGLKKYA